MVHGVLLVYHGNTLVQRIAIIPMYHPKNDTTFHHGITIRSVSWFMVWYNGTTAFPGGGATSTAVSTWMGDRLRNSAAAEPVDEVSVRHLIVYGLRHAAGKKSSAVIAPTAP
jgi:hypothetical protein